MSMVERVAKAIYETTDNPDALSWDVIQEGAKDHCRGLARAAIEAMREPPEAVADVMNRHASNGMVNWRDYHAALNDAALKEPA